MQRVRSGYRAGGVSRGGRWRAWSGVAGPRSGALPVSLAGPAQLHQRTDAASSRRLWNFWRPLLHHARPLSVRSPPVLLARSPSTSSVPPIPATMSTAIKSVKAIAPLLDRILVQRIKAEAKTASGIFLPESSVKELNEAKVLAVGPGAFDKDGKRITPSLAPGDKVLIPQYGGTPIKVQEDDYSLFRESEYVYPSQHPRSRSGSDLR
ncbi:10 kDa heat shock protein, mitochondrial [Diplodia seriata]|uniref:10 kDa heat shock protein, mitochondrial n=1 Tax=Diplodia seriata TaxID=420778 RepID=A0A1S8BLF3_9PEZI|nr:10 kDa heat shock protein, mitochondrial [Diplodia seriata]